MERKKYVLQKVKVEITSQRKLNTYFFIMIPEVEPIKKDKKFLKIFKGTITVVTEVVDSRTTILLMPGVSEHHIKAILDVTHLANARYIARYTDNFQIKGNQPTTFKLLLGHNKATISFSSNQLAAKLVKLGSQVNCVTFNPQKYHVSAGRSDHPPNRTPNCMQHSSANIQSTLTMILTVKLIL